MWIVAIAWMYVATMMTVAEAASPQGSIVGAVAIFVFYGVAPCGLVMYLLGTPARNKARLARERAAWEAEREALLAARRQADPTTPSASTAPDQGRLPAGDAVAPEGKEPG